MQNEIDMIKLLKNSEGNRRNGKTIPAEKVFNELRKEYRY